MIEQKSDGLLSVSGPMLIANATDLLDSGRSYLRPGVAQIVFDLSAVAETDSSALSVVFGWLRTARACGVAMHITQPPASMISIAALYGVSDSLPLA
jgi:phospholipid transport system transporter-binding protein